MLNVAVIGFGNVGALLSTYLLNSAHALNLNIIEPSEEAKGATLDLEHSMALYPSQELHINDDNLFLQADYIFYTAGTPNEHGGSRLSTAQQNIELAKEIFEHRSFENSPFIIVISNPVDLISHAVQKFSGLPPEKVMGTGTFLDSIRMSYYLTTLINESAKDLDSWVLGEHGASQVPFYSNCKLKGAPLLDNPMITSEKLDKATEQTKNAAFQIRETQTGTKYGVVKCALSIFEGLISGKEMQLPLSVRTNDHYRKLLQLEQDIYISLPVHLNKGKLIIDNDFSLEGKELDTLRQSAKIISDASNL